MKGARGREGEGRVVAAAVAGVRCSLNYAPQRARRNEITGRVVARNGMKIRAETEEREREKLNSACLFPPTRPPSLPFVMPRRSRTSPFSIRFPFRLFHPAAPGPANRGFLSCPSEWKEREREKADPCLRAECD